jgi:hypothetical protein
MHSKIKYGSNSVLANYSIAQLLKLMITTTATTTTRTTPTSVKTY